MRRAVLLVAVSLGVTLGLAAPSGAATWMAAGGLEPSTALDRASGLMFSDPDMGSGPAQVYFQAFQSVDELTLDPNLAALDGRVLPPGPAHHRAMLGHWKDCNRDGYVGLAESAIQDYASALLLDTTVCPPGGEYNSGGWVSEMIGIGMVDPCEFSLPEVRARDCGGLAEFHLNERVLYANHTMVWGDAGLPDDVPGVECTSAPLPPGTTSGTGALLSYADCQDGRLVARSVNDADPDGALGLRFEDETHPERSSSALNVPFPVSLFGSAEHAGILESDSAAPAATVWDCGAPRATDVPDPTGGALSEIVVSDPTGGALTGRQPALPVVGVLEPFPDDDGDGTTPGRHHQPITDHGSLVWAPALAPTIGDPTASWWDAVELALDGPRGDCNAGTPSALRPARPAPLAEGGAVPLDEARKDRASIAFTFYDGHRGLNENVDFLLGPNTPADGGLLYFRHGRGGDGPLWSADAPSVNEPQIVTRGDVGFTGAQYWTYYAKLGDDAFNAGVKAPLGSLPQIYGREACGSFTSGIHHGWDCDATTWWLDGRGRDVRPRYFQGEPYAPVPGESYHLRDADCYDGHVGLGLFASLAILASEVC
ncbi:MAG TPA: hypothetical protein VM370_03745 [Candidatus Thermoplasmatota archaeon]|nr:hypothetical protein [Candidatus Thermoplasmatota archaeon]